MNALILKIRLSLLLVMVGAILGSCKYDDEEKMYSSRSYGETYALLRSYIVVSESDEFELNASKDVIDSLRINPSYISKLKGDLCNINQQIKKALNDPLCSQVLMITERQGALVKKADANLKYEINSSDPNPIITRANVYMNIDANQATNANFIGGSEVRTDISVSPGWASPYVINFNCRTGKLSGSSKDYILFTGTSSITLTNWWHANNPNGNNTQWDFFAHGLGNGAHGNAAFQW